MEPSESLWSDATQKMADKGLNMLVIDPGNWTDPFEMLPWESEKETPSCGYTRLIATGSNRFLIIYSDFKYQNKAKKFRKAIKVREVFVTPEINLKKN